MQLATWNVNSLNVRLPQVLDWLAANPVDVLALQELKLTDDKFPTLAFGEAGYQSQWFGQKTYNGVALLSKTPAADVIKNIPGFPDDQSRVLCATINGVRVIGAYFPNGQAPDSDKFVYKMRWLDAMRTWVRAEMAQHPNLVLMGDYNITFDDADVWDPEGTARNHPLHHRRAHPPAGPDRSGPERRGAPVPAAREKLQLVGLPQRRFPPQPGHAHRPHPDLRSPQGPGHRLRRRQSATQERAPERPRAGGAHPRRLITPPLRSRRAASPTASWLSTRASRTS